MRYDTKVYFQIVQDGEYNSKTGDYEDNTLDEYLKYANVTDAGSSISSINFGKIKSGSLVVRVQNAFDKAFDFIRIGEKQYAVSNEYKLMDKGVYVVSEVK